MKKFRHNWQCVFEVQKLNYLFSSKYFNLSLPIFQPDPHGRGKKLSVIIDQDEVEREKLKAVAEEQLVMELIGMLLHVYLV